MNTASQPLVSIVIPVYNQRSEFLRECIESAINQTYANIEIIISDNHSTNGTSAVLDTFKDKRIKIVKPPEHLPLTHNFQWASEQAKGVYISFLPSDDWLEKECIEELVKLIDPYPTIVMAFCNVKQYYNGVKTDFICLKPGVSSSEDEIQAYAKLSKQKGCLVGCILRKSVYDRIGGIGNGNMSFTSDRWLFIQMAIHGDGAYINKSYGVFRNENPLRKYRLFIYSEDLLKLFQLIEQSYLHKIQGGQETIDKERNKMTFYYLKSMPMSLRSGHIGEEEFIKTLENFKKISKTRFIHSIIEMYKKKQLIWVSSILFYLLSKYENAVIKIKNRIKL